MIRSLKTSLLACAVAAILGGAASGDARAEGPEHTLKIGTVAPSGTPWSKLLKRMRKRIQRDTGGRVKVKLYLGGKIGGGSEKSLVSRCQRGTVDGIAVSTGALGNAVPELYAVELPYLFDTHKQAHKALDAATDLLRELMEPKGFIFGSWGENGFRHFASKQRFFETPGALKGMKMRSQQANPHVWMYQELGAGAHPISVGEVTSSLANGVVNGYDNTALYAYAAQWYKEIQYLTLSAHIYQGAVVAWCKKGAWSKMGEDLHKILLSEPASATQKGRAEVGAMNKLLLKQYKASGVEILELSRAQKAAFKKATAPVHGKFLSSASPKGKQLYKLLTANR